LSSSSTLATISAAVPSFGFSAVLWVCQYEVTACTPGSCPRRVASAVPEAAAAGASIGPLRALIRRTKFGGPPKVSSPICVARVDWAPWRRTRRF
jgi:hypothetical protein